MDLQSLIQQLRQQNGGVPPGGGVVQPQTSFQGLNIPQQDGAAQAGANPLVGLLRGATAYNNAGNIAANAGGGGLAGFAPMAAMAASPVGRAVGDIGDSLGLKKTGIPDQIRAMGDFTSGDFGGAWGSLKDSVKNIFSIF